MMVGPIRLMLYLRWCLHTDSWYVVSWPACIVDLYVFLDICFVHHFGLSLLAQFLWCMVLFEHLMIEVRLFHYIIIEHILECLVSWHSVSYRSPSHNGAYLLLGFIGFSTDILVTRFACCYLRVFILGCSYSVCLLLLESFYTRVYLFYQDFSLGCYPSHFSSWCRSSFWQSIYPSFLVEPFLGHRLRFAFLDIIGIFMGVTLAR